MPRSDQMRLNAVNDYRPNATTTVGNNKFHVEPYRTHSAEVVKPHKLPAGDY